MQVIEMDLDFLISYWMNYITNYACSEINSLHRRLLIPQASSVYLFTFSYSSNPVISGYNYEIAKLPQVLVLVYFCQ